MAVEVVVVRASLGVEPGRREQLRAYLTEEERGREARFVKPESRERFAAARGLLRETLAERLALAPADVPIATGANGKPELDDAAGLADLRFNVSHSGAWALIALAHGSDVGVDIEEHAPRRNVDGLAKRVLSEAELAGWKTAATEDDRADLFFAHWTRKEAYAKGLGEGLGVVMHELTLEPAGEPGRWVVRAAGQAAGAWLVADLDAPAGYSAAVAMAGSPRSELRIVQQTWE